MSQLMPEMLATWSWRLERVRAGRTVLTRGQAVAARTDLRHDRAANPEEYAAYEEEFDSAVSALSALSQQPNRHDDLLSVLAIARRREGRAPVGRASTGRDRHLTVPERRTERSGASLAAERDRVPSDLPDLLGQWVHRLIRYRNGAKLISPLEASRAEIHLRNEAALNPAAYRQGAVRPYLARALRDLGEIATTQRLPEPRLPGPPIIR